MTAWWKEEPDQEARDRHLDAMAQRASAVFDGEGSYDVACVCAGLMAAAIASSHPDRKVRQERFDRLVQFIADNLKLMELQ